MYVCTCMLQCILPLAIDQVDNISLMCKPDGVINICNIMWMVSISCDMFVLHMFTCIKRIRIINIAIRINILLNF